MNIDKKFLTQVINDWDPVGLLAGGALENEYSIEVREISQKSSSCKSETDFSDTYLQCVQRKNGGKIKSTCLHKAGI